MHNTSPTINAILLLCFFISCGGVWAPISPSIILNIHSLYIFGKTTGVKEHFSGGIQIQYDAVPLIRSLGVASIKIKNPRSMLTILSYQPM